MFDVRRDDAIREITRRLIDYYHPERIYLFGSAARGYPGPDSDLDFCVILPSLQRAPKRISGVPAHTR
jgi:predicted nucleotidyltransferase